MNTTRRIFVRGVGLVGASIGFPTIIPSRVLGADAPSNKINILRIACGRIRRGRDMPGILRQDAARLVALCDVDSLRLADGKELVDGFYQKKIAGIKVAAYGDNREVLQHSDIDVVSTSTPDDGHAEPVMAAALVEEDIHVQKPLTMTIQEGRAVSDVFRAEKCMFQIGSQQHAGAQFRIACEMVRSGRIGKLHTGKIGLPSNPAGGSPQVIPVPKNLNDDMWLGCAPLAPLTEDRTHPQGATVKERYSERPGWLRIEDCCLGLITGWESHPVDIAHWGMDTELTGPISIKGKAEFPTSGLWNVHGPYQIEMGYANGVTIIIDHKMPDGIRFEGSDGWIFVTRSAERVTASDPVPKGKAAKSPQSCNPDVFKTPLGKNDVRLHESRENDHHLDWITSIQTRKAAVTPPAQAHRSISTCITGWLAMKLGRKLKWDPVKEKFEGDDAANDLLSRPERTPLGLSHLKKDEHPHD